MVQARAIRLFPNGQIFCVRSGYNSFNDIGSIGAGPRSYSDVRLCPARVLGSLLYRIQMPSLRQPRRLCIPAPRFLGNLCFERGCLAACTLWRMLSSDLAPGSGATVAADGVDEFRSRANGGLGTGRRSQGSSRGNQGTPPGSPPHCVSPCQTAILSRTRLAGGRLYPPDDRRSSSAVAGTRLGLRSRVL